MFFASISGAEVLNSENDGDGGCILEVIMLALLTYIYNLLH